MNRKFSNANLIGGGGCNTPTRSPGAKNSPFSTKRRSNRIMSY